MFSSPNCVCVLFTFSAMIFISVARPGTKFHIHITNRTKSRILNHSNPNRAGIFESDNIFFPDTFELVFEPLPTITGPPPCAEGNTFCEDYEDYPKQQIKNILKNRQVHRDLFGQDPIEFTNRLGDIEDEFICASSYRTIYPKIAKNKNNKWKYIINTEEKEGYIQGIRIEICRRPGTPCDIIGNLPNGYVTTCKQKYIYRRLMSLSNSGDPVADLFELPSACCCAYRRDIDFLRNLASPVTPRI